MKLLCLAHRGEAKSFIKNLELSPVENSPIQLYQSDEFVLLITGEGIQSTTENVSIALTLLNSKITSIVNLGIAGALNLNLNLGEIYSVRTTYAERMNDDVEFKSFTSDDSNSKLDNITAIDRVITDEHRKRISPFADIVDRELWAIGSVAKRFNKPFNALKLISDFAGNGVNCFDISFKADEFSEKLYTYFFQNFNHSEDQSDDVVIEIPDDFYTTTAQKRLIYGLLDKLSLKYKVSPNQFFASDFVSEIIQSEEHPKKRTIELIEYFKFKLNPINEKIKTELNELMKELYKVEAKISFPSNLEDEMMKLNIQISDKAHFERLKNALNIFDYDQFLNIINGEN